MQIYKKPLSKRAVFLCFNLANGLRAELLSKRTVSYFLPIRVQKIFL